MDELMCRLSDAMARGMQILFAGCSPDGENWIVRTNRTTYYGPSLVDVLNDLVAHEEARVQ